MKAKKKISDLLLKWAQKLHKRDFYIESLQQKGILNWQNNDISGELHLINEIIPEILLSYRDEEIVIVDVGANKGDYFREVLKACNSKLINSNFKFHLFEPQNLSELNEWKNNPRVVVNKVCVGKEDGFIDLFTKKGKESHTTTVVGVLENNFNYEDQNVFSVPLIKLETYLKQNNIKRVHFLKIDTEGNEFDVLLGLGEYLLKEQVVCIQFEFNEMNVYSRVFFRDFFLLLADKYDLFRLGKQGLIPIFSYNTHLEIFKFQNYFAILKKK